MHFWKTVPGAVILVALMAAAVAFGGVAYRVYEVTHPPRQPPDVPALTSVVVPVDEITFEATDAVRLSGWILRGRPDMPFVVLCHDRAGRKGALLDLAVRLQKSGFNLLVFDFRGHGASGGRSTTLGIGEQRDVLGAVDYLESLEEVDARRVGVYGVGMGAHAAVLAATSRPAISVLVLDGLYPDPRFPLARAVYRDWTFGVNNLGFVPEGVFMATQLVSPRGNAASEQMPRLAGRHVLLLAPAQDEALASASKAMYEAIPQQGDADGNLVLLPATRQGRLNGEDRRLYDDRVASFFEHRLVAP